MSGLIAKKIEMTRIVKDNKFIPITILELPNIKIVGIKKAETDGYSSVVLGVLKDGEGKGILKDGKKGLNANDFVFISEITINTLNESNYNIGDSIDISILDGIENVGIEGYSKGKGFAGAMKRHNFHGGPSSHGSKFHRALGSIGTRKPRRTHKGKKMHGHMGDDKVNLRSVPLELVNKELNIIGVRGGVPGSRNSYVKITF